MKFLSKLPLRERPREKLNCKGAKNLSDVELLAVLLGSGVRQKNVLTLADRACSVIVAHNHPSGDLEPSDSDKRLTEKLCGAADILGIQILDHLIFSARDILVSKTKDCSRLPPITS